MIAAASSEKRGVLLGEEGIARMKNRSQLQGSPKRSLSLALRHDFARRKSSVSGHGSKFHETEDGGHKILTQDNKVSGMRKKQCIKMH